MKKLVLLLPIIVLLAAACNSQPSQPSVPQQHQQQSPAVTLPVPNKPTLTYQSGSKPYVQIVWNYDVSKLVNIYRNTDKQNEWVNILPGYDASAHAAVDYNLPTDTNLLYYRITTTDGKGNESVPSEIASILIRQNGTSGTEDYTSYKNTKFGFEIKIPKNWIIKEESQEIQFSTIENKKMEATNTYNCQTGKGNCNPEFSAAVFSFTNVDYSKTDIVQQSSDVTINGMKWYKYAIPSLGDTHHYQVKQGSKVYDFVVTGELNEVELVKILSTFKFTN